MTKQLNDWMAIQPLDRQNKTLAKTDQIQAFSHLTELRKGYSIISISTVPHPHNGLPTGLKRPCQC